MKRKVLLSVLLIALLTCGFNNLPSSMSFHVAKPKLIVDDKVTISFVGDCTLGSYKGSDDAFGKYYKKYGSGYFLSHAKEIFDKDDITFANLEGPLTKNPQVLEKKFSMRGDPDYVNILKDGSVEVVNLSNNHIYDCGDVGFNDTINVLDANNIAFCGEGKRCMFSVPVKDLKYGGLIPGTSKYRYINVCFLGYKGWEDTKDLRDTITKDIKDAKDCGADIICAEFHWGVERENYPNKVQQSLAHFAIDSECDVVVGAHPHVLQGIEKYNGKVIAYSLGNFCFGGNKNPSDKDTMILQVTFDAGCNMSSVDVIPYKISTSDTINDFSPNTRDNLTTRKILDRINEYSKDFNDHFTF